LGGDAGEQVVYWHRLGLSISYHPRYAQGLRLMDPRDDMVWPLAPVRVVGKRQNGLDYL
jgi:hypothetical protein